MHKTGLFFGSFNPIRNGHLIIAQKALELKGLDEVWFVVSPKSPFKEQSDLAEKNHRINMVNLATNELGSKFLSCNIEFNMPIPSYTIDTVNLLKKENTDKEFSIIMGADNLSSIKSWKNYEELLLFNKIIAFKRPGIEIDQSILKEHLNIDLFDFYDGLSATYIRNEIKAGRSIKFMVPDSVIKYITDTKLYL